MRSKLLLLTIFLSLVGAPQAFGLILYSTATRNTDPPGSLTNRAAWDGPAGAGDPRRVLNSGWQYQGQFGIYLGTPIAPNYFITAQHIGGSVGNPFVYQNLAGQSVSFNTNGVTNIAGTDLRIWRIDGTFDHYAPMWNEQVDGAETGKPLVVFGRGTQRGSEVIVGGTLRGWNWGTWDTVQSWGENEVTDIVEADDFGELLAFDFNAGAGPNEASLSSGDSGGGVFIQSTAGWKLAGINLGVTGPFRTTPNGTDFFASLFNAGGLYVETGDPPEWQLIPDATPGTSYSSRISSNLGAIEAAIAVNAAILIPEPTSLAGLALLGIWAKRPARPKEKKLSKRSFID